MKSKIYEVPNYEIFSKSKTRVNSYYLVFLVGNDFQNPTNKKGPHCVFGKALA